MNSLLPTLALAGCLGVCVFAGEEQSATTESLPKIITGRVVRATDGSPVAGAKVDVKQTPQAAPNAEGHFVLHHNQDAVGSAFMPTGSSS